MTNSSWENDGFSAKFNISSSIDFFTKLKICASNPFLHQAANRNYVVY